MLSVGIAHRVDASKTQPRSNMQLSSSLNPNSKPRHFVGSLEIAFGPADWDGLDWNMSGSGLVHIFKKDQTSVEVNLMAAHNSPVTGYITIIGTIEATSNGVGVSKPHGPLVASQYLLPGKTAPGIYVIKSEQVPGPHGGPEGPYLGYFGFNLTIVWNGTAGVANGCWWATWPA